MVQSINGDAQDGQMNLFRASHPSGNFINPHKLNYDTDKTYWIKT